LKKILSLSLVLALILSVFSLSGCSDNNGGVPLTGVTINVYNWGEYIADGQYDSMDVNKEFTKRTGIKVNYTTFATNEEMYAKLKAGGSEYDIIIPSDYMIGKLIDEGMLEKLNFDNIPNYKYIGENYKNLEYDLTNEYSVPYTWGTVGVFYNKTMVDPEDVENMSWDILWNEKYKNQILMFDNPRDSFAIALKKLGYSMNTTDENELQAAYEALADQKDLVQAYVMDQIFTKMANGEAALAPYYAGDYVMMNEDNPDIEFAVPKEGTNSFVDAICIPVGSKHKTEAEMYIDFLCDPEISAENAEYIGYSTPNTEALDLIDPEIAENPIFYPSEEVMDNTETYITLPKETNEFMENLWVKLKTE